MSEKRPNRDREPLTILIFSGSLRTESLNTRLVNLAITILEHNGIKVNHASMHEFDCPSFNQDTEKKGVVPEGATEFKNRLLATDAFIISSPEYNGSMPGHLKNAIDWVSRFRPQPFNERHALLMSASPSLVGGNRGLWSLRVPLEHLGTRVFPNMFSLSAAHKAFDDNGGIKEASLAKRFEDNLVAFANLAEAAKHYPCIKKAWVEFLGEKTDEVTDRAEV